MQKDSRKPRIHNFKKYKRLMKVVQAIINIERNTAELAEALLVIYQEILKSQSRTDVTNTQVLKDEKNKKVQLMENWLDKQDLREMFHISERSLYSLRKSGVLESYTFKGKIYYNISDVEKALKKRGHGRAELAVNQR